MSQPSLILKPIVLLHLIPQCFLWPLSAAERTLNSFRTAIFIHSLQLAEFAQLIYRHSECEQINRFYGNIKLIAMLTTVCY